MKRSDLKTAGTFAPTQAVAGSPRSRVAVGAASSAAMDDEEGASGQLGVASAFA